MPKIVDHDQYRRELLEKSFDLFAIKGYASITMREIAQGIGVSTGTLYHYFPSKQALFEQLFEQKVQQDLLMVSAELAGLQTLQARIEAIGHLLVKKEDYFLKQTLVTIDFLKHQDREVRNRIFRHKEEPFTKLAADLLGIADLNTLHLIKCLCHGLIVERLMGNEDISYTEQTKLLGKILTTYLEQTTINQPGYLKSCTN